MFTAVAILEDLRVLLRQDPRPRAQTARAAGLDPVQLSRFLNNPDSGLSVDNLEKLVAVTGRRLAIVEATPPKRAARKAAPLKPVRRRAN